MACELLTREFANSKGEMKLFAVRQLPASKALDLYVELMNKVGTTVFPLIDDKYSFNDLITLMRANPDNTIITELIKRLVCMANFEGKEVAPVMFDIHFNGEQMLLLKVFAFVLETNFQAFFKQGLEMNEQFRLAAAARLEAAQLQNSSPEKT